MYRYMYTGSSGMLWTICNLQLSNNIDLLTITLLHPLVPISHRAIWCGNIISAFFMGVAEIAADIPV